MDTVRIAVVGAGVIGLSTAVCISQVVPGCSITVISDKFSPDTTSNVAAGILIPHTYPGERGIYLQDANFALGAFLVILVQSPLALYQAQVSEPEGCLVYWGIFKGGALSPKSQGPLLSLWLSALVSWTSSFIFLLLVEGFALFPIFLCET